MIDLIKFNQKLEKDTLESVPKYIVFFKILDYLCRTC